jgi:hypothetical protein
MPPLFPEASPAGKPPPRPPFEIKSFSLIRYDDCYFHAGSTAAMDMYASFWIFLIAVHDSIFQSFAESQLNLSLGSRHTVRSFYQAHHAFC